MMNKLDKESVIGISALLVHAANIDEIYSEHEKDLIKDFIRSYLKDEDASKILEKSEKIESNSNQLLNYTNIIKQNSMEREAIYVLFGLHHLIFNTGINSSLIFSFT